MAGTLLGGKRAAAKNKERHGEDFYVRIGKSGGMKRGIEIKSPKGFAANPGLARIAGRKGGTVSRRGKKIIAVD